jgi:YbgC/YbaW family acyl-CoA thioester hydrolase
MMPTPFRTSRRVEFADTDMAGIVHFANFFRWMEGAEVDFLVARGLSVKLEWEGEMLGFPRVSASCDYLKPASFLDILEIAVSVRKVGRKSVTYDFEFTRGTDVIARGSVSSCCCRVLPGHGIESVEIPASLRQKLTEGLASAS